MAAYAGFQALLIQNLGEFQKFAKFWIDFLEFRSKFTKFRGNSWNSSQVHWAFITGFPMSSMGGVWIFSGIAHIFVMCFFTKHTLLRTVLLVVRAGSDNNKLCRVQSKRITYCTLKCIYHLWRNFVQRTPVGSKDHMQKISGIGLSVFPQLSFLSSKKSQNYDVTPGTHIKALYGIK